MKLLILELDDVLIKPRKAGHEHVMRVSDIDIPDNVFDRLKYYKKEGWTVVVMTDQPLVAAGKRTIDQVWGLFYAANHILGGMLDGIVICPHDPQAVVEAYRADCKCKKPKTGMFDAFLGNYGTEVPTEIMVVGMGDRDYNFAAFLGAKYRLPEEFF